LKVVSRRRALKLQDTALRYESLKNLFESERDVAGQLATRL
jgi:hypothetical protein